LGKKDIIYIGLLVAILAALLTLVLRTEVQANASEIVETTEIASVVETTAEATIKEVSTECTTVCVAPVTTTEIPLTTVKFEDIPDYTELGIYKLTAYCSCGKCCGKSNGITASGSKATAGRTVAAKGIPFGTELMINGETYIVEDRGVGSGVIDIYFDNHSEALSFGVKYAKVYEVTK
jgi:3D (Asp-Asp-Asp) domain-containing protein